MGEYTERLSEKVGLARVRVGRYLRKGESGKIEDVEAYVRKGLSVPEAHQLKIAKDTLKMPGPMAGVMGGPSPEQAKKTVARLERKVQTGFKAPSPDVEPVKGQVWDPTANAWVERTTGYKPKKKDASALLQAQPSSQLKTGSTKAREAAAREYIKAHPRPPKYNQGDAVTYRTAASGKPRPGKITKVHPPGSGPASARNIYTTYTVQDDAGMTFELPEDLVKPQASAPKAPRRLSSEELAAKKKAGTTTKVRGYAGPKRSAKEAKAILERQKQGEYLGDDGAGNQIKVGASASVIAGPEKGVRGTITGRAKGGGIAIRVAGNLGKSREVLVDPDELRTKSR